MQRRTNHRGHGECYDGTTVGLLLKAFRVTVNGLWTCLVDGEMIDVRALHIILFSVCVVAIHDIFWIRDVCAFSIV